MKCILEANQICIAFDILNDFDWQLFSKIFMNFNKVFESKSLWHTLNPEFSSNKSKFKTESEEYLSLRFLIPYVLESNK